MDHDKAPFATSMLKSRGLGFGIEEPFGSRRKLWSKLSGVPFWLFVRMCCIFAGIASTLILSFMTLGFSSSVHLSLHVPHGC